MEKKRGGREGEGDEEWETEGENDRRRKGGLCGHNVGNAWLVLHSMKC